MGVKDKTVGEVRYFTYYLIFPDGEQWVDQIPFVHDLQWELQHTVWDMEPYRKADLLKKGETFWKDHNSVEHRVVIESTERQRRWGVGTPQMHRRSPKRQHILRKSK